MSAICGVFAPDPVGDASKAVDPMVGQLRHRGPGRVHRFDDVHSGFSLAHSHLSAFRGDHAHFVDAGEVAAALDGCARLDGTAPTGWSGVAAAYRTDGLHAPECFAGPFTLALWDKQRQAVLLARHGLGEKSLYYHHDPDRNLLIFASEIKAILAHPSMRREIDREGLALYLAFGYVPGDRTLFRGVKKLLPGERLWWRPADPPRVDTYWRLPTIGAGIQDEAFCIRGLKQLFLEGLERYVDGASDVGVFLSGGVDSSIIVAGLRELGVPNVETFTVGFEKGESSDRLEDLPFARAVAKRFGTRHHEVMIGRSDGPGRRLLKVLGQFDDLVMTPNMVSKHLLAEAVREAGLTSVLTGSAAAGACGVHRKFLDAKKRAKLLEKTSACASDEARYYELRGRLFDLEDQRALLCEPPPIETADILDALHRHMAHIESTDFFRLFLFSNLMITSTEKSLKVLDGVGALSSVEIRSPYLDRALVEFSTQLPSSFDGGATYVSLKTHLKRAFADALPSDVLDRPVIGYPSYYWNQGELADLERRVLSREAIEAGGLLRYEGVAAALAEDRGSDAKSAGKHTWALLQLALWHEIHIQQNPEFTD
jgi:asparagine synthase (glutamine-hydrolysing)